MFFFIPDVRFATGIATYELKTKIMKEEFLQRIDENQGIIHKISILYARSNREREDLVQEIILQLWKSFPQFKGNAKFSTWMYRVAINTALMNHREKSFDLNQAEDLTGNRPISSNPFMETDNKDVISLYIAIDHLSPINKAIILLYLDDESYEEIADIMGMNVSNVGVRISRIKKQLKKIMEYENI